MKRATLTLSVCAALLGSAFSAHAATVSYVGNGFTGGHALSGTALFTTNANQVSIFLSNTTPVTYDSGELLTSVKFTVDGVMTTATLASASAIGRNVNGGGNVTDNGLKDLKALNTWSVTTSAGTYNLNFNPDTKYGIIGAAEASNGTRYAQADGTINGAATLNPFAALSASFVLNISGVTASSNISNVQLFFGTSYETRVNGTLDTGSQTPPVVAPEPATLWGGGALLGILAGCRLLTRRKAPAL